MNAAEEAASASAGAGWDEHRRRESQSGADVHEVLVCYYAHYYDDSLCCFHTWDPHDFCGLWLWRGGRKKKNSSYLI